MDEVQLPESETVTPQGDAPAEPPKRYGQDPTKVDLLLHPHPALKQKSIALDIQSEEERAHAVALGKQMVDVTKAFGALGLAANQLGGSRALFVMRRVKEVASTDKYDIVKPAPRYELTDDFTVCINPLINSRGAELAEWHEGCLSFPGKKFKTKRAKTIHVTYITLPDFTPTSEHLDGLQAVIFQHEWSHLHGKTIADRAIGLLPSATKDGLQ